MDYMLGEARFYFAQCVFNASCHYAAYSRYEKERDKRHTMALMISGINTYSIAVSLLS